jgi:hypothetical protein
VIAYLYILLKNIFYGKKRKLKISIDLIEKSSLAKLRDELKKLDVQWI